MAYRGFHNDVAGLLLERSAGPYFAAEIFFLIFPLHESATAGNLSLARKLFDHGALPDRLAGGPGRYPALFWAFSQEHENIIQLLLEREASFDGIPDPKKGDGWVGRGKGWLGQTLAEMIYQLNDRSMAEILQEHGFQITEPGFTYLAERA